MTDELFEIDRQRYTCAGGTAPLDLMLHLVAKDYSREVAWAISEQFTVERIRDLGDPSIYLGSQPGPGGAPDYLNDAVLLMRE